MAEIKKKGVRTKVSSTVASNPEIDYVLDEMTALSLNNGFTNGKMIVIVKVEGGTTTKNEVTIEDELSDEHIALGNTLQNYAVNSLAGVADGKVRIVYKTLNTIEDSDAGTATEPGVAQPIP